MLHQLGKIAQRLGSRNEPLRPFIEKGLRFSSTIMEILEPDPTKQHAHRDAVHRLLSRTPATREQQQAVVKSLIDIDGAGYGQWGPQTVTGVTINEVTALPSLSFFDDAIACMLERFCISDAQAHTRREVIETVFMMPLSEWKTKSLTPERSLCTSLQSLVVVQVLGGFWGSQRMIDLAQAAIRATWEAGFPLVDLHLTYTDRNGQRLKWCTVLCSHVYFDQHPDAFAS